MRYAAISGLVPYPIGPLEQIMEGVLAEKRLYLPEEAALEITGPNRLDLTRELKINEASRITYSREFELQNECNKGEKDYRIVITPEILKDVLCNSLHDYPEMLAFWKNHDSLFVSACDPPTDYLIGGDMSFLAGCLQRYYKIRIPRSVIGGGEDGYDLAVLSVQLRRKGVLSGELGAEQVARAAVNYICRDI